MHKFNNHNGFTLIELSIVLVIIGLLVGLGAGMIGPLTTFVKVRETRELQDATLQSITSWASSRNAIPNSAEFSTAAKSPRDAWGQDLIYLYDAGLDTNKTICGSSSTTLTLILDPTDPATTTRTNVAFLVLSRADNTAFKSTLNNLSITASGAATGTVRIIGPTNSDLVRWVTLDELRGKISCQGAPLRILNNEMPYGNYSAMYSAKIMAEGGSGSTNYQWRIKGDFPSGFPTVSPFINSTTWKSAPFMNITGHPYPQRSYYYTIHVRDNIGNSSSKPFVMTVNPR